MNVLIIGGTRFVGRAITKAFLDNGHKVTLFNRGITNPDIFPGVRLIKGDREADISNLGDDFWDIVVDTCGYVPRIVKTSLKYLKNKTDYYVFISTISVYEEFSKDDLTQDSVMEITENQSLVTLEDETVEDIGKFYGGLKVLCEKEVMSIFKNQCLILRPGLIVGPYDHTNRFTYWPVRIRKGGEILAPGNGDCLVQYIDVRDLAEFCLKLTEKNTKGTYNVVGPQMRMTFKEFLLICLSIIPSKANIHWIDEKWLLEQKVQPWMELPLWIPGEKFKSISTNIEKALTEGLTFRELETTIKDILEWYDKVNGESIKWPAGMKPEIEKNLLERNTKI